MTKHIGLLFLFSLFLNHAVNSQIIENSTSINRLWGYGTIGKDIKISMTLDLIPRTDYTSDMCVSKRYEQISGIYTYTKNGGSIPIIGQKISWTLDSGEIDSLVIFELNNNYEKTAEFIGSLSNTNFKGKWINLKSNRELPFNIDFNSNYFGNLSTTYKGERIQLIGIENGSYQSTYKLLDKIDKNDTLYLIIRTMEPCCGYYNCRGINCGGSEEFLYLFSISNHYQKYYKELISSDCNGCEILSTSKASDAYSFATEDTNGQFIIKIDYKNLDKGIQKIKIK